MKITLKLEELAMFGLGILAFNQLDFAWWWFLILILTPDIGMLGYLINSKIGALTYNICHHKGLAILIYFLGIYLTYDILQLVGIILFSHAALDRVFGYGLKFHSSFNDTHLGPLKKIDGN
ncbi:DUF4260 domain-containing protein [Gelidibacter sp. F63206]|uniref:DUF4260 domain-containing protein n=1 Tax=Gelidibacter sp. F63206 TaxID=2926425 RepID=UPI001FF5E2A6|nr:DUF4260 domain-containing protein [Gelidibacter sp. F63206]MCK0114583.1 DUF4260 domain-containing protein [Gelidibacter sp. F63206]